jgi:hypothetical protein
MRYDHIWGLHDAYRDLWVPWYRGAIHCSVYCGLVHGRLCFFIEPHSQDDFFKQDAITVATMTICGLRSSAKLLWNFYLRVISDPM